MKRKANYSCEKKAKRIKVDNLKQVVTYDAAKRQFLSGKLFDEDWYKLGGFPDYRPYAQRELIPMPIMLEETDNVALNKILRFSLKRKKENEIVKHSKRQKLKEIDRLSAAIKKEKAMNRDIEHNLRQKLKT